MWRLFGLAEIATSSTQTDVKPSRVLRRLFLETDGRKSNFGENGAEDIFKRLGKDWDLVALLAIRLEVDGESVAVSIVSIDCWDALRCMRIALHENCILPIE